VPHGDAEPLGASRGIDLGRFPLAERLKSILRERAALVHLPV
jgi:hypothetical protein